MGHWLGMQDSNLRMPGSKPGALPTWLIPNLNGVSGGIRTPDTRLRRPVLYPTELQTRIIISSNIKLSFVLSHFFGAEDGIRTRDPRLGKAMLYH